MASNLRTFDYYNIFQEMDDFTKLLNKNFNYKHTGDNKMQGKTNIFIEDENLHFEIYVPGFSKNDININVDNDTLSISGALEQVERKNRRYLMKEKSTFYNKFYRNFSLPQGLNLDAIEASYIAGILTISIPYTKEVQKEKRNITIS